MVSIPGFILQNIPNITKFSHSRLSGWTCFTHFENYIDQFGMDLFRNTVTVLISVGI